MTNRVRSREDVVETQPSDKRALRRRLLAARRDMPAPVRAEADHALVAAAVAYARGSDVVAAYAPMPGEPGGPDLLGELAAVVPTLLLPVLEPDRQLDWAAYEGVLGPPVAVGFRSPPGPRLGLDAIRRAQVVFVPAVAVDRTGARLGRGGGSYDRTLVRVGAGTPVVALLYEAELIDAVPVEPHDRPVTAVLLPSGTQSCGSRPGR